jgi:predicted XRE-type DNA-binding protein
MAQRQFYASDTKDVGKIPKLWLLPFLKIIQGHYPGATLRVDHGGLMLSLPDDRHAQVAQAAKVNIYLDATLNREDLALALGIAPEEIAVVCQAQPETPNLSLIQVPDLGRLGRQRGADQERRIQALITEIKKQPGITKVIDFKDQNQDGAHFVDGRGVNFFQDVTHLAIVGTPCANLMDLQSTYSAMNKTFVLLEDEGFQSWVQRRIEAELIQEIGRLRAHRRLGESLTCYILNDFEFESITVQQVESKSFTIEAAPKLERTRYRILKAAQDLIDQGMDLSQRALATVIGMSRTHISEVIRDLYGSWEAFKTGWSVLLLDTFIGKPATSEPPEPDPDLEETARAILQGLVADPPSETPKTIVSLAEILGWQGLQRVIQGLCQDDRSRLGVNFLAPTLLEPIFKPLWIPQRAFT